MRYKKQAQEMETDINERKGESTDQHKYAVVAGFRTHLSLV